MDLSPNAQTGLLAIGAVAGLTWLLRLLRNGREELGIWVSESSVFKKIFGDFQEAQKAHIAAESEATRNLVRDVRDEMLREIDHLRAVYATRAESERTKGRLRTLESLTREHHGVQFPGDSSTFDPGNLGT